MNPFTLASQGPVDLESVIITAELNRPPSRHPDYKAENQALLALAEELTNSPRSVLQKLVDTALKLCRADSAGVSLLEEEAGRKYFRWHAVAGQWSALVWDTTTPRDNGPCGTVLDRNATLLFSNAHRYYAQFAGVHPLLVEGLLVPFHVGGEAVGTVWVIAHDERRKFDAEDRRLLESLATFAATAYKTRLSLAAQAKANHDLQAEIAERKQVEESLRESEQRLASLIESSNDAIVSKSPDGIIQSWNAAAERLFGYTADQAVGRSISLIIPPDRADEEARIIARLRTGERVEHFDTVRLRSDGRSVQVSLTISPIKDVNGRFVGASKIARDITDRKRLETELREADRRKNEFLAMLAHELRNPLAPICNALQIMQLKGEDGRALQSAAKMMERQVGQMVRMVDDLLDVSRISQGKIELRKRHIDLASAVNQAVEVARSLSQCMEHELTVTLPQQPVYLNADATRLAQVVGNLLNNACKFTDKGGRILLTVEVASQGSEPPEAIIRVRDNGVGIAADQLHRIFDMFTQVDTSLERSVDGLGIGLMLVKSLVEMHGGTVEVHSAGVGQGSEFVVRLPILIETSQPPPPEPTASGPTAATARRILVVDDNRDSATSLAMLLKMTGNETHTAYDGLDAVEAAATFRPDVVLLDIGLPKLNGYEACRRIRKQPRGKEIILIALTGWGQEEERQKSKEAGFDGHMVKPVDLAALRAMMDAPPASRSD